MAILSRDTSRDAERVQIEILRRASPQQKLEMLRGMHRTAVALTRQGLQRRHPTAFKVDVFVSKLRPFDRSSFARREVTRDEYLRTWAESLGVQDLLERALKESA